MITALRNTPLPGPGQRRGEKKLYIKHGDTLLENLPNAVAYPLYL